MKPIVFLIALSLLIGCGPEVFFDASPSVDFAALSRTYAFLPRLDSGKNTLFDNGLMDEHIQRAVTAEMSKRNYTVDTQTPELMIKFHVMVENKEDIVNTPVYTYPMYYGWYRYPYYYYPGPVYTDGSMRRIEYKEGTLVIDVVERSSGRLIWRGWSVGRLENPVKFVDQVPHLIHRMFLHFPVQPKKLGENALTVTERRR